MNYRIYGVDTKIFVCTSSFLLVFQQQFLETARTILANITRWIREAVLRIHSKILHLRYVRRYCAQSANIPTHRDGLWITSEAFWKSKEKPISTNFLWINLAFADSLVHRALCHRSLVRVWWVRRILNRSSSFTQSPHDLFPLLADVNCPFKSWSYAWFWPTYASMQLEQKSREAAYCIAHLSNSRVFSVNTFFEATHSNLPFTSLDCGSIAPMQAIAPKIIILCIQDMIHKYDKSPVTHCTQGNDLL